MCKKIIVFIDFVGELVKKLIGLTFSLLVLGILLFIMKSCFFSESETVLSSTKTSSKCHKKSSVTIKNGDITKKIITTDCE